MHSLGTHLIIELEKCNQNILDDKVLIETILTNAASESGAQIIGSTFHKFIPIGVTGVVSISESHLAVHTWPELSYASVDIFSCGDNFNLNECAQKIIQGFQSTKVSKMKIDRGIDNKFSNQEIS